MPTFQIKILCNEIGKLVNPSAVGFFPKYQHAEHLQVLALLKSPHLHFFLKMLSSYKLIFITMHLIIVQVSIF